MPKLKYIHKSTRPNWYQGGKGNVRATGVSQLQCARRLNYRCREHGIEIPHPKLGYEKPSKRSQEMVDANAKKKASLKKSGKQKKKAVSHSKALSKTKKEKLKKGGIKKKAKMERKRKLEKKSARKNEKSETPKKKINLRKQSMTSETMKISAPKKPKKKLSPKKEMKKMSKATLKEKEKKKEIFNKKKVMKKKVEDGKEVEKKKGEKDEAMLLEKNVSEKMEIETIIEEKSDAKFDVKAIVGEKVVDGEKFYRVRWEGFGEADDTWEPKENLEKYGNNVILNNWRQSNPAIKNCSHALKRLQEIRREATMLEQVGERIEVKKEFPDAENASSSMSWKELNFVQKAAEEFESIQRSYQTHMTNFKNKWEKVLPKNVVESISKVDNI